MCIQCRLTKLHVPLWLDVCTSANVVFGGQNKFVVEHPLRFMVQDCRRVQLDNLVVFYSQVMPRALQMSHLHDKRERKKTTPDHTEEFGKGKIDKMRKTSC